jgi:WSC domain
MKDSSDARIPILAVAQKHHLFLNERPSRFLVSFENSIHSFRSCRFVSSLFVCSIIRIVMAPRLAFKALALLAGAALPIVSAVEVAFAASDANCWQYKGCYNETDSIHPLQFKILPSLTEDTNNENCQSACLAAGYLMSGTADAYNCWCDNTLNAKSNKLLESYCNVPCNTVTSETCGGYYAVSVYSDTCLSSPPAPSKTITITAVQQPTPTNIHTIYTTVIVTGPQNPQYTSTRTSVIYVQAPTTTNPYSSARQPPYRSTTTVRAPQNTCSDILCCLLSSNCDYSQYINGNGSNGGISLILGGATGMLSDSHFSPDSANIIKVLLLPTFFSFLLFRGRRRKEVNRKKGGGWSQDLNRD